MSLKTIAENYEIWVRCGSYTSLEKKFQVKSNATFRKSRINNKWTIWLWKINPAYRWNLIVSCYYTRILYTVIYRWRKIYEIWRGKAGTVIIKSYARSFVLVVSKKFIWNSFWWIQRLKIALAQNFYIEKCCLSNWSCSIWCAYNFALLGCLNISCHPCQSECLRTWFSYSSLWTSSTWWRLNLAATKITRAER